MFPPGLVRFRGRCAAVARPPITSRRPAFPARHQPVARLAIVPRRPSPSRPHAARAAIAPASRLAIIPRDPPPVAHAARRALPPPPASCSHPATRASCSHPARPLPPRTKTRPYLAPISLRLARRPRFAPFCLPPVRLPRAVIISCGPSAAHKNPPSPPREIKTHFFGTYARLYAGGGGISRE